MVKKANALYEKFPVAVSFLKEAGFSDEFLQKEVLLCFSRQRDCIYLSEFCEAFFAEDGLSKKDFIYSPILAALYSDGNKRSMLLCRCSTCQKKLLEYHQRFNAETNFSVVEYLDVSVQMSGMERLLATDFTVSNFSLNRFLGGVLDAIYMHEGPIRNSFKNDVSYKKRIDSFLKELAMLKERILKFRKSAAHLADLQSSVAAALLVLKKEKLAMGATLPVNFSEFSLLKLPSSMMLDLDELMNYKNQYNFSTNLGFLHDELFMELDSFCYVGSLKTEIPTGIVLHVPAEFAEFIFLYVKQPSQLEVLPLSEPWTPDKVELAACFLDISMYPNSAFSTLQAVYDAVMLV